MTSNKESAQGCNRQYKIRNHVFRLLKIRERSIKEIRDKLKTKKFTSPEIEEAIKYFQDLDLLNDRRFTQQWIRWRLSKPYGLKRIAFELKIKGIDAETIRQELTVAEKSTNEEEVVYDLAIRRLQKYKNIEPAKAIQRLYGYLSRRGFQPVIINKTLYKIRTELKKDRNSYDK